jgi:uncharacterized protein YdcH (DUF465 family)
MKLTLRKANIVQAGINDAVKGLKFDPEVKINEFQDVDSTLVESTAKFMANVDRRRSLTNALHQIRLAVGAANNQAGIDSRLTTIAHLEKQIQFYAGLSAATAREDLTVVRGKLDKIKTRPADARSLYGYNDHVDTGLFAEADLAVFKTAVKDMKKQKQKLQDEVLELNVRTEIEVSEEVATVLGTEGLV